MHYAEVAVDAPSAPERTFSYSIPNNLEIQEGHLVEIPFGRRTLQGIVVNLTTFPQFPETKPIARLVYDTPIVDPERMKLIHWISQYYICSLFEAAKLTFPTGAHTRQKIVITLNTIDYIMSDLSIPQQKLICILEEKKERELNWLIRKFGENIQSSVSTLERKGLIRRTYTTLRPRTKPLQKQFLRISSPSGTELQTWLDERASRAPNQRALIERLLSAKAPISASEGRQSYGASAIHSLIKKGWIEQYLVETTRDPLRDFVSYPSPDVVLTNNQKFITSAINHSLQPGVKDSLATIERHNSVSNKGMRQKTFLIQGVTGSGKTEIYVEAAKECIRRKQKTIILVPEIALTNQIVQRFLSSFPGNVAVLHSQLSAGERYDQWWKIREGQYDIVIGARSAIFAPQPNLGLIVIDEEHEWTYKQRDSDPRYHARDTAIELGRLTNATVVLGSASPDVESYFKGLTKRYRLHLLQDRFRPGLQEGDPSSRRLANVSVVDMRKELRAGNKDIFSQRLKSAMTQCLSKEEQFILFINRRGFSSYLQCKNCGLGLSCSSCDIPLTYHNHLKRFMCHFCGKKRTRPTLCPNCSSDHMSYHGIGTESVVERLRNIHPHLDVAIWDSDNIRNPKNQSHIIENFRNGNTQALVGTQMIAKGLHFPMVTLVGVVSADVGLHLPDYRTNERTFQLLCQVAGRAGRGIAEGEVIIQTYSPENYAIQGAAQQDYQSFYTKEMAYRRQHANPPYSKIIRLLYADVNEQRAELMSRRLASDILEIQQREALTDIDVIGPHPAWPSRARGKYRWHIILRGPEPKSLLHHVKIPKGWVTDVDPVSLI